MLRLVALLHKVEVNKSRLSLRMNSVTHTLPKNNLQDLI